MNKLVILRGKPTSGKTTAFHTLKKKRVLKDWEFIDLSAMKNRIKDKEKAKRKLFELLKISMRAEKDILIEEMSEKTARKYISYYIRKYNYKIITFQFEVNLKEAHKRNIQRAKDKWHSHMTKKELEDFSEIFTFKIKVQFRS